MTLHIGQIFVITSETSALKMNYILNREFNSWSYRNILQVYRLAQYINITTNITSDCGHAYVWNVTLKSHPSEAQNSSLNVYNIQSNSTENSVKLIFRYNFYRQISTDPLLHDGGNNNQFKSIPFLPFRNKCPPRSNTSGLCSQMLPWPLFKSFPLFQLPPVPLPSSSFSGFLFDFGLGYPNSKLAFLW